MKKMLIASLSLVLVQSLTAQVYYYKAEWTMKNKHDLFTGICRIEIKDQDIVKGKLVWKFLAVDSTDQSMMDMYKGKKGKTGIEYVEGTYTRSTHDIFFEGKDKDDPYEVLGLDKYSLKISDNKQVLYGTTATGGTNSGLFYALRLNAADGAKKFAAAKAKCKKK